MLPDLRIGDRVQLRKAHPCGSFEWKIVRLGADIGLVCLTCEHKVLLTRRDLAHRMKKYFPIEPTGEEAAASTDQKPES